MSRELLAANRTYYVRTDGDDANQGLMNTPGGAFLTRQRAIDVVVANLDLGGYGVTIQVGNGTYTGGAWINAALVGSRGPESLLVQGDPATPSNVLISTPANVDGFTATGYGAMWVRGFKIVSGKFGIAAYTGPCMILFDAIDFGACTYSHIYSNRNAYIEGVGNWSISGNGTQHVEATHRGSFRASNVTVSFLANVTFTRFAYASAVADITFTGTDNFTMNGFTCTGQRHLSESNSLIQTFQGANFFPGNSAGGTATGGQYIG